MAVSNLVLDIPGCTGECKIDGYEGKVECESFSFGASLPVTDTGSSHSSGNCITQPLVVSRGTDKASAVLMKKMGAGTPYDKVVLSVLKKVGADDSAMQPYLTITLLNAFIENSSVSMGANGAPQETVIIGYAKVEFQYKSQNEDGSLSEDPTWRYDSTTGKNYG